MVKGGEPACAVGSVVKWNPHHCTLSGARRTCQLKDCKQQPGNGRPLFPCGGALEKKIQRFSPFPFLVRAPLYPPGFSFLSPHMPPRDNSLMAAQSQEHNNRKESTLLCSMLTKKTMFSLVRVFHAVCLLSMSSCVMSMSSLGRQQESQQLPTSEAGKHFTWRERSRVAKNQQYRGDSKQSSSSVGWTRNERSKDSMIRKIRCPMKMRKGQGGRP